MVKLVAIQAADTHGLGIGAISMQLDGLITGIPGPEITRLILTFF